MFICFYYYFLFQSFGGLPCNFCGNRSFQDNCNVYNFPDCLLACLFWDYLGSYCWSSVPSNDHAFGSCETIHFAQVFQRGTSSRFRCRRIWRGSCFIIQPHECKFSILSLWIRVLMHFWFLFLHHIFTLKSGKRKELTPSGLFQFINFLYLLCS